MYKITSNHPFFIKLIEEFIHKDEKDIWKSPSNCIVTEYISGGDLISYIEKGFDLSEE
jgi:hypothetical protein